MTKLRVYWEAIGSSLWFVPSLMAVAAVAAAFALINVDRTVGSLDWAWLYTGGPEGAREVLGTIASSMVGVAGVAFSITIVALSLASQQLGPRLLRSYMRDRGNQVVLGTFVATFLYCILVLRTVRGTDGEQFVPEMAVTVGVLLAVCSLGVLIYFIHHMSMLIQAPTVIAVVAAELDATIDRMFPERIGEEDDERDLSGLLPTDDESGETIDAESTGFIESVDPDALLEIASKADIVVRLLRRPGHFVFEGSGILRALPCGRLDERGRGRLSNAVTIAPRRSPAQDVEFAIQQLVEVALRALSPASNDPFTAIACIERLGAALARLGRRRIPSPLRADAAGHVRVIAYPATYTGVVDAAFDQIRQNACENVAVAIRMLDVIAEVGACGVNPEMANALLHQAEMIERATRASSLDPSDRKDLARRFVAVRNALTRTCGDGVESAGAG